MNAELLILYAYLPATGGVEMDVHAANCKTFKQILACLCHALK